MSPTAFAAVVYIYLIGRSFDIEAEQFRTQSGSSVDEYLPVGKGLQVPFCAQQLQRIYKK